MMFLSEKKNHRLKRCLGTVEEVVGFWWFWIWHLILLATDALDKFNKQWLQLITLKESFTNIHGFPSPFSINFVQKKIQQANGFKNKTLVFFPFWSSQKIHQKHSSPHPFENPANVSLFAGALIPGLPKPTVLQQAFFCSSAQANCQLSTSTSVAPNVGGWSLVRCPCGQGDGAVEFSIATWGLGGKRCQVGGKKKKSEKKKGVFLVEPSWRLHRTRLRSIWFCCC